MGLSPMSNCRKIFRFLFWNLGRVREVPRTGLVFFCNSFSFSNKLIKAHRWNNLLICLWLGEERKQTEKFAKVTSLAQKLGFLYILLIIRLFLWISFDLSLSHRATFFPKVSLGIWQMFNTGIPWLTVFQSTRSLI